LRRLEVADGAADDRAGEDAESASESDDQRVVFIAFETEGASGAAAGESAADRTDGGVLLLLGRHRARRNGGQRGCQKYVMRTAPKHLATFLADAAQPNVGPTLN
jgi:hypothetical protein